MPRLFLPRLYHLIAAAWLAAAPALAQPAPDSMPPARPAPASHTETEPTGPNS